MTRVSRVVHGRYMDREQPQRKPYSKPKLKLYGDIRQLTQNLARNNVRDGGSNSQRT
ncbi:MAG: hypothetical protein JWO97_2222 [Acidobacteria bacterium]|nr:hypothetical protein [Acidobacteriota bacterium]